ncbi:hypothetical protein VOLCADRAFT_100569 [Volvox carteri f. nagariensis]|uniref:Uncharacterized protein n=1 Tax=Volvox carteri f. nagariensis TaxID=3068 RepID=D8UKI4_VOLCA|nr:uncharacterized protein VOLCADRAFT_100569 [Volvox carteri f. nagariensis]EFJ39757.1 hypothetical protein VOLCADRAFT_100569 [Volvox carteri f. nagariensis]|eukprot:XP_002959167.1 hypothetical protein VOLCADRAFT_100569 [Volvox carteri f. nagariensis]
MCYVAYGSGTWTEKIISEIKAVRLLVPRRPTDAEVRRITAAVTNDWRLDQAAQILGQASVLVGAHGSGLANMIWMSPGRGGVLEVKGGDRERGGRGEVTLHHNSAGNDHYHNLAHLLGHKYLNVDSDGDRVDLGAVAEGLRKLLDAQGAAAPTDLRTSFMVQYKSSTGHLHLASPDRNEILLALLPKVAVSASTAPTADSAAASPAAAATAATTAAATPAWTNSEGTTVAALTAPTMTAPLRPEILAEDAWPTAFAAAKGARRGRCKLQLQLNTELHVTRHTARLEGLRPLMTRWGVRNKEMLTLTLRYDGRLLLSRQRPPGAAEAPATMVAVAAKAAAVGSGVPLQPEPAAAPPPVCLCRRRGSLLQLPNEAVAWHFADLAAAVAAKGPQPVEGLWAAVAGTPPPPQPGAQGHDEDPRVALPQSGSLVELRGVSLCAPKLGRCRIFALQGLRTVMGSWGLADGAMVQLQPCTTGNSSSHTSSSSGVQKLVLAPLRSMQVQATADPPGPIRNPAVAGPSRAAAVAVAVGSVGSVGASKGSASADGNAAAAVASAGGAAGTLQDTPCDAVAVADGGGVRVAVAGRRAAADAGGNGGGSGGGSTAFATTATAPLALPQATTAPSQMAVAAPNPSSLSTSMLQPRHLQTATLPTVQYQQPQLQLQPLPLLTATKGVVEEGEEVDEAEETENAMQVEEVQPQPPPSESESGLVPAGTGQHLHWGHMPCDELAMAGPLASTDESPLPLLRDPGLDIHYEDPCTAHVRHFLAAATEVSPASPDSMILTPRVGGSCCSTEQLPWAVAEMAAADARLLLMVREAKGDEGGEEVEAVNGQQEEVIGPLSEIAAILLAEGISPVVLQQMLPPGQPASPPPPPLPPPLSPRQLQEGVSFPTVPQVPEEARQWQPPLPLLPYAAAADGAVQPAAAIPAYDGQWVALPGCAPPPPRRPGGSAGSGRAAAKRGPSSATAGSMYDNDWAPASSGRCTASAVATDVTHRRPSSKRRRKNDGTFKPSKPALANVQHIPAVQPASSSPTLVQPLPSACSLHRAVQPPPPPASRARFSVLGRDLPNEYSRSGAALDSSLASSSSTESQYPLYTAQSSGVRPEPSAGRGAEVMTTAPFSSRTSRKPAPILPWFTALPAEPAKRNSSIKKGNRSVQYQ